MKYKPPNYDIETSSGEDSTQSAQPEFSIEAPMIVWILILVIALVLRLLGNYITISSTVGYIANLVLFMPGSFILPIIIGAAMGAGIGRRSRDISSAMKTSVMASVYASIIYVVAIVIIYEVISYTVASIAPSISFLLSEWLALPVATLIVVTIAFSILSNSSRIR